MAQAVEFYQVAEAALPGDAVFHCMADLRYLITRRGYRCTLMARYIHPEVRGIVSPLQPLDGRGDSRVVIYHFTMGAETTSLVCQEKRKRASVVLFYHNVTPARYFRLEDPLLYQQLVDARRQLRELRSYVDLAVAMSDYSGRGLRRMGYDGARVLPPIFIGERYQIPPDERILKQYNDGKVNLLCVGRIAPNKRQEDVIKAFYYYRKLNPRSRLFLVGDRGTTQVYYRWLQDLVSYLGLKDVHFCGRVSQSQLHAYYRLAQVFLFLSQHEGFGIPLVESMHFGVPVVARRCTAVAETLGQAGILMRRNHFPVIAEIIDLLVTDADFRFAVVAGQKREMERFSQERVEEDFWRALAPLLERVGH